MWSHLPQKEYFLTSASVVEKKHRFSGCVRGLESGEWHLLEKREEGKNMLKHAALFALVGVFALGVPDKPTSTEGSWQVDARHSDARLITDGTTDYGKTKIDVALGVARVNGRITLDNADPTKSNIEFRIYPATAMTPAIDEDGKFLNHWLMNMSNHTLVCFHSKQVTRKSDGKLQATGDLILTRVDRNVDATPSEGYSGPVYGPPMLHRVSREATFVFDLPASDANGSKGGEILATGSTSMHREDFPQLVRAVLSTYWPPVVQDENCQAPSDPTESYHGSECTGTFIKTPALPAEPHASGGQDVGIDQGFNAVAGNHLTILVHLRLAPSGSTTIASASGN
jgi:polyisoprenoid-binding protein YceI